MTPFDQFLTALRTAHEQAKDGALLPCPFCGSDAMHERHAKTNYPVVICKNQRCAAMILDITPAQAAESWNRRTSRNSLPQTIAIMEVARKAIEDAPHDEECYPGVSLLTGKHSLCRCWKAKALAEIDAIAAKTP